MAIEQAERQHIDRPIRQFLALKLPANLLPKAEEMVGRFCDNGQIAVATLLVYAEEAGKFEEALTILEEFWKSHWGFQHPEIRGNPDLSNNHAYYGMAYSRLGIQPPFARRQPSA